MLVPWRVFFETPKIQHHNLPKGCFRKNAVAAITEHTSNLYIKTHRRFGENKGFDPTVEGFGDKKGEANRPRFKFSSGTLMYLFNTTKVQQLAPDFHGGFKEDDPFLPIKFFSGTFQHLLLLNFGGIYNAWWKIWEDPSRWDDWNSWWNFGFPRSDLMKTLGFLNLLDVSVSTKRFFRQKISHIKKPPPKHPKSDLGDFLRGEK